MDNTGFTDINKSQSNGSANGHATGTLAPEKTPARPSCLSRLRNMIIHGLEMIFFRVGMTIATHPVQTIILSIIPPLLLSIGIMKFKFNEDFAELLLPPSSRIFDDRAWVREHVPFEQRPIRLILKNENVLSKESILALYDFHTKIEGLQVHGNYTFETMCVRILGRCFVDSLLALWFNDLERLEKLTDEKIIYDINTVEKNTELRPIAKELEYAAIDLALGGHPAFSLISVFTMDSYAEEFFGGVYGDIILIVYGFPVVLVYIIMALGKPNLTEHGVFLTLAAIVGVILSAGACFGIGLACGFLFGAPHQALIFLLLAVGVDDAFVIITTWTRINKAHMRRPIEERVAITMQHAGVSVTVTSFSDLVAFACGISTQMPVLKSFCIYCSFGILFLFLMQSTLFPACLTLNQRRIEARRDALVPCIQYSPDYEPIACSQKNIVKAGIKNVSSLKKGYELEKSLPADSYTRAFLESQRLFFSAEGPGIQTFCGPMDYHQKLPILDRMCNTYVNSSYVMYGLVGNWIPVYKMYVGLFHPFKPKNEDGIPEDEDEFYITWSYFPMQQIVSTDVWENEHIMEVVRRIADDTTKELGGGKCFCYSVFHIFTEVIRYVDTEIMRNFLLAGVAIFLVTLLLIVDIPIRTRMRLSHYGLAVDFSAHIGYTFMTLTGTRKERATHTIEQIGPAILHGAVTTFLVFFVLIFGRSLNQFFAVFILVVVYGLWHGLCFLPVVLSLLGPEPYYNAGPDMPKKSDNDSVWIDEPTIIPPTEDVESKDSQVTTKSSFGLDSSNIRYGAMDGGSEEAPAVNNDVTSVAKEVQNTDL
ncbi:LOW QUALITY PROTEIN: PTHD3-like protein [Mya arenaria]|uniref:PTHD3-like protein n=1 Tax=Mya arenaria TaxID=6604 RepID=A0ABY7GBC3_MYAAR|nr:LOW QUALITY PROTEIN: PTHD3-like protein [Mya arenaria]